MLTKRKIAALDIGFANTKLLVLEEQSKGYKVLHMDSFNLEEEGILQNEEISAHLKEWINELGYGKLEFVLQVPQELCITNLSDFPEVSGAKLDNMVKFETQQLAGLSDESYMNDYIVQDKFAEFNNPVFLGICQESVVRERETILEDADLQIKSIFLEGQGQYHAYLHQVEEPEGLDILLDIGASSTCLTILLDGNVYYMNSIPFGGQQITDALSSQVSDYEAEKLKCRSHIIAGADLSPINKSLQSFIDEFHTALEHWHLHFETTANLKTNKIYISGGGASLTGIADYLSLSLNADVDFLCPDELEGKHEFSMVYGLAAAALDNKEECLELTTPGIKHNLIRKYRMSYLYFSAFILTLAFVAFVVINYMTLEKQHKKLLREQSHLKQCEKIIKDISENRVAITNHQNMLRPFAARGNRNITLVKTIDQLSKSQQKGDWFVYLADADTYMDYDPFDPTLKDKTPNFRRNRKKDQDKTEQRRNVSGLKAWNRFYTVLTTKEKNLETVRTTVANLRSSGLYKQVDTHSDFKKGAISALDYWRNREKVPEITEVYKYRMRSIFLELKDIEFEDPASE